MSMDLPSPSWAATKASSRTPEPHAPPPSVKSKSSGASFRHRDAPAAATAAASSSPLPTTPPSASVSVKPPPPGVRIPSEDPDTPTAQPSISPVPVGRVSGAGSSRLSSHASGSGLSAVRKYGHHDGPLLTATSMPLAPNPHVVGRASAPGAMRTHSVDAVAMGAAAVGMPLLTSLQEEPEGVEAEVSLASNHTPRTPGTPSGPNPRRTTGSTPLSRDNNSKLARANSGGAKGGSDVFSRLYQNTGSRRDMRDGTS